MRDKNRQRKWQREWMAQRRNQWLSEHGPCVDCGTWDRLEIDHVDRLTKVAHNVWSWRDEKRLAELAKCAVRCRSCHLKKSVAEMAYPPHRHGTTTMYRAEYCRCALCRQAHTEYRRRATALKRA